jgi:hypothetical protein
MPGSQVRRQSGAETLVPAEPSGFMAPVRVCGGASWATTGYTRKATAYSVRSSLASAARRA